MSKTITIKRISLDHVWNHDKILYNTNNHPYSDDQSIPPDYEEKYKKTDTRNWIDKFHTNNYKTITLDRSDIVWMSKALYTIGFITGRFSHLYDDELEMTCKKYENQVPKGNWFIRSDRVSLKEGVHGIGPYNSIKHIIESIVSCSQGHIFFKPEDIESTIYFMNWQEIDTNKEFRVFVHNNEITAISAQHLYSDNEWLNNMSDDEIKGVVSRILYFFTTDVKNKLEYLTDYTFDFAFVEPNETPYFIEPNSFGRHYAAGSSLYHWIYDHDTLHDSTEIEIRYSIND